MFGHRTPTSKTQDAKTSSKITASDATEKAGPSNSTMTTNVRRSIGDWETGSTQKSPKARIIAPSTSKLSERVSEAKGCLMKAKHHL
ncbi:hypothetical protein JYU34_022969, partial [Plutella xylostella]